MNPLKFVIVSKNFSTSMFTRRFGCLVSPGSLPLLKEIVKRINVAEQRNHGYKR
jgi:hypothetical protein